jgi:RND family efflux transporter MFP subunit
MDSRKKTILTAASCGAIILLTALIIFVIRNTEPEAEKGGATRKSAALVSVIRAERGDFRPEIVVLGTVQPAREIMLSPRVAGEILRVAPEFKPGRFIGAGDTLLELDAADYENTLALRQSALLEAEAALAIEKGRAAVAAQEFELLGESIDASNRALVLREPQIASAQARVASAQAALDQAQLDLERTEIRAPFDAQVLERYVNLGSQVSAGEPLARLVGIEEYWVTATVPVSSLQWIDLQPGDSAPPRARVRSRSAWAPGVYREAKVAGLIGTLDAQTRLARVLVTAQDPLSREGEAPPLILDSILEVRIEGRQLSDVVRLDRSYLRGENTVWVKEKGQLSIREVVPVFQDAKYAYISEGLNAGDLVVTTNLATVAEGVALRVVDESTEAPQP